MNLRPIKRSADNEVYLHIRKEQGDSIWDLAVDKICYKLFDIRDRIELNIVHNTYTVVHDFLEEQVNESA